MTASTEISVILVSYNTSSYLRRALESLFRETQLSTFEVIVVDNASSDDSASMIRQFFPQVTLIESGANLGFAGGVQLGAAQAHGNYLLLLNPDTVIVNAAVDRLLRFAKQYPDSGIWSGVTLNHDLSLNTQHAWSKPNLRNLFYSAVGLSKLFSKTCFFNNANYGCWERDTIKDVDIVSGCFFLTTRELWDRLGGLDTTFFMYAEEADYCLRAKALGHHPIVTPDARIIHHGGVSHSHFSGKQIQLLKGKVELVNRHVVAWQRPVYKALLYWYVLNQYLVHTLFKPKSAQRREWQTVFANRADWLQGYR